MVDESSNIMKNGNHDVDSQVSSPRPRQQYHYLYGSTDSTNPSVSTSSPAASTPTSYQRDRSNQSLQPNHHHGAASPTATDQDSLVGESLVPTDNEQEEDVTPNGSHEDFAQLILTTNGSNGRVHALPENKQQQRPPPSCWTLLSKKLRCRKFQQRHPFLHAAVILGAVSLLLIGAAVLLFPHSWLATSLAHGTTGLSSTIAEFTMSIPFSHIDRSTTNDPVSHFLVKDLLAPEFHAKPGSPHDFIFPFPTGAFWVNFVLPPTADRGLSYPVAVYPYAYKWSNSLLQVSYPIRHRQVDKISVHDYFFPDLTFAASEQTESRYVTQFDPLSVTLRYNTDSSNAGRGDKSQEGSPSFWETYLVQGSPYVTIKYENASPWIQAFSIFKNVICPRGDNNSYIPLLEGDSVRKRRQRKRNRRKLSSSNTFGVCSSELDGSKLTLRGVQFALQSNEGMNWIVFSSEPIALVFDTERKTTVVSPEKFTGVLRVAYIPPSPVLKAGNQTKEASSKGSTSAANVSSQVYSSPGLQRLIYHAGVYPVSADVSWSFRYADAEYSLANAAKQVISGVGASLHPASLAGAAMATSSSATSSNATKLPLQPSTIGSSATRVGTITFTYSTRTFAPAASTTASTAKPLLMLALPHHAQSLSPTLQLGHDQFDLVYGSIKGPMRPVIGSTWAYDEPLPTLGLEVRDSKITSSSSSGTFTANGGNSNKITTPPRRGYKDSVVRSMLIESLAEDIILALPTLTENIYGFGKQSARLAQLAYIAFVLKESGNRTTVVTDTNTSELVKEYASPEDEKLDDVFNKAVQLLQHALESLFTGNVSDTLVFDDNLGGIVTTDGLRDTEADFGNGRYNDHLFHYGYILYAAAILGKLKPTFVHLYAQSVDALYYDVAHGGNWDSSRAKGVFFPGARHKAWFDGHSFASGLFPFGNGKSQESSSEAVNCYYGAYLWMLVRHNALDDPEMDVSTETDFARLLLATEIRGAQMYWHMVPSNQNISSAATTPQSSLSNSVYNPEYSKNYMVGNLGMLDAVSSTWFGTSPLYVHMINELPVTAITEQLFDKAYVTQEYSQVLAPLGEVEMPWRGYVVCNHAVINPNAAWKEAQSLFSPTLDSGISKSQVLYFIATRPDFNPSLAVNHTSSSSLSGDAPWNRSVPSKRVIGGSDSGASACLVHPTCASSGLVGECCPTPDGVNLDCCGNR